MLLVTPARFNRFTGVPVVLPIAGGGEFARMAGFAVSLDEAGTRTSGAVRCDQPWAIDIKARSGRKLEAVPERIMEDVLARLAPLFRNRRRRGGADQLGIGCA